MNAIERLRRDHAILRSKLDVLEAGLSMGPEAWFVLREVCFTLARQLRDHIKREEDLVAECRNAMNPKALADVAVEHRDERMHLYTINRLFVTTTGRSLAQIRPALLGVIEGLRHHMAEEEAELFPIFERTLSTEKSARPAAPAGAVLLEETMTVNRVVQECPGTKSVFERLFVNIPIEGCTCLDEVAWRHGMTSEELLKMLGDAVASCDCRSAQQAEAVPAGAN